MTLLRIIIIAVLTHMAFVAARMTASLYALVSGASTFTVGVIMALFALVPMLTGVRAGRWLDAVGPRRPTVIGTLLMLGGTLLPAVFPYATADVAPLRERLPIVSTRMFGGKTEIRVVGSERPDGMDVAEPSLEDVYFATLAENGINVAID